MSDHISYSIHNILFIISLLVFCIRILKIKLKLFHYLVTTAVGLLVHFVSLEHYGHIICLLFILAFLAYLTKKTMRRLIIFTAPGFIILLILESLLSYIGTRFQTPDYINLLIYSSLIVVSIFFSNQLKKVISIDIHPLKFESHISLMSFLSIIIVQTLINTFEIHMFFANIVVLFLIITLLDLYFKLSIVHYELDSVTTEVAYVKDLNLKIRAQKHDFNNHLQVISAMIQAKKYESCFDYIINLNKHGHSKNNTDTGILAINALLNSKQDSAQSQGIFFEVDVADFINAELNMQSWEVISILGNLIDNAIRAELKSKKERKAITITIKRVESYFKFKINNSGSFIEESKIAKMFEPGFTTKRSKNHGIGLHIIKDSVERHGGNIRVESTMENGTTFILNIPVYVQPKVCDDIIE